MVPYRGWKPGQVDWEEYREIVQAAKDQAWKAKAPTDLNLAKDVASKKKSFCRYAGVKRNILESMGPLQKETGDLVTQEMER